MNKFYKQPRTREAARTKSPRVSFPRSLSLIMGMEIFILLAGGLFNVQASDEVAAGNVVQTDFSSNAAAMTEPQPRLKPGTGKPDPNWQVRHQQLVAQAQAHRDAKVVFLGDSITDWWNRPIFNHFYQDLDALNLGVMADGTEHLLWRISNGELNEVHPKVVVVLIGINNFLHYKQATPEQVAGGIRAVVTTVQARLPSTKILLIGLLPKGEPSDPIRAKITETNQILASFDDGNNVRFLDIGKAFLNGDGTIPSTLSHDKLHPTPAGYEVFAEAINPTLFSMLNLPMPASMTQTNQ